MGGWVLKSGAGEGAKLHVPTPDGMVTFEDGVPREADDDLVAQLQEQGYEIQPAEVPPEPEPEKPADKGALDYDSVDDDQLRELLGIDPDDETEYEREDLIARVKEARGD